MKPVVSIVVIGLNEEKLVGKCLDSLVRQQFSLPLEIIFVDGKSQDSTVEIVKKYQKKLNLVITEHEKATIGDARQTGFGRARGEIILSTDADVILPGNWIRMIYDHFQQHPGCIGLVGPYTVYPGNVLTKYFFLTFCRLFDRLGRVIFGFQAFRGMNFAISRKIWEKSRGFVRTISALEDAELAFKASKYGKICYLSNLVVHTTPRRFKNNLIAGTIYRLRAFYYRIYLRDQTKFTQWKQIRE